MIKIDNISSLRKINRNITGITVFNYLAYFKIKHNEKDRKEIIRGVLNDITSFFRNSQYINCCQTCGREDKAAFYIIDNQITYECSTCYNATKNLNLAKSHFFAKRNENILLGLFGALIGSVMGIFVIIFFGQFIPFSSLSGSIMAISCVKSYETTAGKLSKLSFVICSLISLTMTFIGSILDWCVSISAYYNYHFFTQFDIVLHTMLTKYLNTSGFLNNLLENWLFVLLALAYLFVVSLLHKDIMVSNHQLIDTDTGNI